MAGMLEAVGASYRPGRSGPEWRVGDEGLSIAEGDRVSMIEWSEVEGVDVVGGDVRIRLPRGARSLTLGQRWNGSLPPSAFLAIGRSNLPEPHRSEEVDQALRRLWGWSRGVELGRAGSCVRCGGRLGRVTCRELRGSFGAVEATLREVERRECERCAAPHPLDRDQMSDLLFDVSEQWARPDTDWSAGAQAELVARGRRLRGDIRVRVEGPEPERPAPGDVHLAVLDALCGESLPA